jgi:hypothetical protein
MKKADCEKKKFRTITISENPAKSFSLICFIVLNLLLGLCSEPVVKLIETGLNMFA